MTQQELFDQFWGYYYGKHYVAGEDYRKAQEDAHSAAAEEIHNLDITALDIEDERVTITLRRPGLLIGLRGNNIIALQEYLKLAENNENLKVHIEEERTASLADRIISRSSFKPWMYHGEDW